MPAVVGQKKRKCLAIDLFGVLLFSILIMPSLVNSAKANPFYTYQLWQGSRSPDGVTKPPAIMISSPENHMLSTKDSISLSINVSVGESTSADLNFIGEVYYTTDWQTKKTIIYSNLLLQPDDFYTSNPQIEQMSKTLNLTDIPDGNHSLTVHALERGTYHSYTRFTGKDYEEYYFDFEIDCSSSVFFTVDTTAPNVSILSTQNETFYTPDVDLSFVVDASASGSAYSIDGKDKVTVAGNTTLSGLPVGVHNVTVYAWDTAGNVGASETVYFTIEEPETFPTTMIIAPIASVAVIGVGLLVYFKKRRH